MTIYEIIESIASTSSTKEKQAILERNKDNELLKKVFYYAYNPRINFWIKPEDSYDSFADSGLNEYVFESIDKLINREITGDRARNLVVGIMSTLHPEDQEILRRIMLHDLRCGASDTIASKVWKNLVPDFSVLLCSKFDSKAEKYLQQFENNVGFSANKKMDGGRVIVEVDDVGIVSYRSRNGSPLNLYHCFDKYFTRHVNSVFDGELLAIKNDGKFESRTVSNGRYTKCVRGTLSEAESKTLGLVIWDIVPIHEYLAGKGTVPYNIRQETLNEISTKWDNKVSVVDYKNVKTLAECMEYYAEMRLQKEEGIIIKVMNSVFEDKRSKNYVKVKNSDTADLLCVGIEEGTGKYSGMIGSLICETSDGLLHVNVGTGLKDSDRDPSIPYTNSIIEVSFNELITSKSKTTHSLFLPVYVQRRHDKSVANSLAELM